MSKDNETESATNLCNQLDALSAGTNKSNMHAIAQAKPNETMQVGNDRKSPNKRRQMQKAQITLPRFSGNAEDWYEYAEKFKKAVHDNNALDQEGKLELLQSSCSNEIKQFIDEFYAENYEGAWEKLNGMYGNAYKQASLNIQAFLGIAPMQETSYAELSRLHTQAVKFEEAINKSMEENKADAFIALILIGKMDPYTKQVWEGQQETFAKSWAGIEEATNEPRNANEYLPTFQTVTAFLKSEAEYVVTCQSMQTGNASENFESKSTQNACMPSNHAENRAKAKAKKWHEYFEHRLRNT